MLPKNFVPELPFPDFKWKWACLQCTEGIDDPVVLLGVLFRMRKLEGKGLKYSSPEFAKELTELSDDIKDSIGVDLARRTGERNLIRNSGQYWRAVGLIPAGDHSGEIRLTDFWSQSCRSRYIADGVFNDYHTNIQTPERSNSEPRRMFAMGKQWHRPLPIKNYHGNHSAAQRFQ